MLKDYPDHHDAELVLKLYDLRREATMRESRSAINGQFWPKDAEEVLAITKRDHPLNAAWRQTSTYWEMVYSLAKHGIVHADFLMESAGEGILLYAKIESHLEKLRELNPQAFRNAEWVTSHCETGKRVLASFRQRVADAQAARQ